MVMLATGHDRFEARAAIAELDPLDEPHVMQEVEGAVDAGDAGIAAGPAQPLARSPARRDSNSGAPSSPTTASRAPPERCPASVSAVRADSSQSVADP